MILTDVEIALSNIKAVNIDERNEDEPYLWTVFFTIDGGNTQINFDSGIIGQAEFEFGDGSQGNIGEGFSAGESREIPSSVGSFKKTLKSFEIENPLTGGKFSIGGIYGCITILLEEDAVPNYAIKAGKRAFQNFVEVEINIFINDLDIIQILLNNISNGSQERIVEGMFSEIKDKANIFMLSLQSKAMKTILKAIKRRLNFPDSIASAVDPDDFYGFDYFIGPATTNSSKFTPKELEFSSPRGTLTGGGLIDDNPRFKYKISGFIDEKALIPLNIRPRTNDIRVICIRKTQNRHGEYVTLIGGNIGGTLWRMTKDFAVGLISTKVVSFHIINPETKKREDIYSVFHPDLNSFVLSTRSNIDQYNENGLMLLDNCTLYYE